MIRDLTESGSESRRLKVKALQVGRQHAEHAGETAGRQACLEQSDCKGEPSKWGQKELEVADHRGFRGQLERCW